MDRETRCFTEADLEVRYADKKPQLVGYALKYNTLSADMGFRERVAPGAFTKCLANKPDVRAMCDHDTGKVLGRTTAGTMTLDEDGVGLRVTINPPDTQIGRDTVESVRRGDLTGMSFGFRALNDSWDHVDGHAVRTVLEADLFDVSIVAFPSYPDTSIAVRSLDRWRTKGKTMADERTVEAPEDTSAPAPETTTPPPIETTTPPSPERRSSPSVPSRGPEPPSGHDPAEWRNYATGKEVRVLKREDRFASLYTGEPLSMGKAVRAMIVGSWDDAPAEHRALSTTANPTAGILVPNPLAASVIDKARALAVLTRAGAVTVDMTSGTLTIARVATDATMESKAENASFAGSDVVFDAVELTAYTIGTVVKMSRELAQDAPNAVQLIEDKLAAALAAKLDWYGLQGTGSQMPLGLVNFGSTNTVAVGGSVDFDDILDAIKENEVDNHVSNALVMSPANANMLRQLKVNAEANHYAAAPAAVSALQALVTTGMPDATMVVGDFTQFIIGLRQSPTIEVTTEGGDAFEAHQVFVKVTWRGCFNTTHRDAFALLTGIA